MAQKSKRPAAVATAGGAKGFAIFSKNTSIDPNAASSNSFVITSIRRGPGGWAQWVVSIEGDVCAGVHVVCTDVPVSDKRLRSSKRFCKVLWHRFGVNFKPMPPSAWSAIVDAALAKDGAA